MVTMQDALLALNAYWTERGCLTAQPMNSEVGAGTLNPATFLRVQGPEPWRVAYTEPSVRPDDSRYGENPNRLQTHTQYQVILKPEPGDAQELYLGSLKALGIDTAAHDIRFVEDNWASPALGAWGLGWEVWLDGLEITQFTYFQQAGGIALDPVSVEITYGIERILMALQGVGHFKDIAYADGISYGEIFGQAEYEMSRYYLDDADIEANRTLFETYAGEARRMLAARLPVPAYSYVLKCSHTFNVLDARGAISTTERARAFARMRRLAHEAAQLWAERRTELGHPLGLVQAPEAPELRPEAVDEVDGPQTLIFEIGVEELPAAEVGRSAEAVRAALETLLAGTRLRTTGLYVKATPRRIVAMLGGVEPYEDDREETARGPRVAAAYDEQGQPTAAARGFARGQGLDVADLGRARYGAHEHVTATRRVTGRPAATVLAELLPQIVTGLRAEKNMRWQAAGLSFSRPVRWLLALLGDDVVPFTAGNLASGRTTYLHRTAAQPAVDVATAYEYWAFLAEHGVIADGGTRRRLVARHAVALAERAGGTVDTTAEAALVEEIADLVEYPTAILGSFEPRYLELPAAVLTTVMRKHQRYLPVQDAGGALLPHFVVIANGECDHDLVRAGNEAVLRARYEDAAFFWRADLETPLDAMKQRLHLLTFEERLGSMADRADRIAAVARRLSGAVELSGEERSTLERAAQLAKFDLGSQMVTELSSLAGVMARAYALRAGEPEPVAQALHETELPRSAADAVPDSLPGALLALADRFDLLAGLFALGSAPTGSSDPYGLRRAALGVVAILRRHPRLAGLTVADGLAAAAAEQPVAVSAEVRAEAELFVRRRLEQLLLERGHAVDHVRAVLPVAASPARAEKLLAELEKLAGTEEFAQVAAAVQRVRRIVPAGTPAGYDLTLFADPAEEAVHHELQRTRGALADTTGPARFTAEAQRLTAAVNRFFDEVLVMAEDPAVRANRLGLLASVQALADPVLRWEQL
ncbi:glycine--tRNA ligase [Streptomyces sp. A7024]|uniref:Multifunctional fusion protein n=1 Tax=Streptomyces coryli TaxID=1128680 RepID=A0A6G4U2G4_9ACTN|nr:glycine--tRNA ligase [Streptomyces coryli]NGN66273.1 glycine--tRNA ligase [Streptomyces coryli]